MSQKKDKKTSSKPGQSSSVTFENDNEEKSSILVNNIGVNPKVLPATTSGKATRQKAKLGYQSSNDKIKDNLENTSPEVDSTKKSMKYNEDLDKQQFAETEKKLDNVFNEATDIIRQMKVGNRLLQTDGESKSSNITQSPPPCEGIESTSVEAENNYRKYINSLSDLVYNLKNEIELLKGENFKLNQKISEMSNVRVEPSEYNTSKKSDKIPCDACDQKQKIIDRNEESLKEMPNSLNNKDVLCDEERLKYTTKISLLEERNQELKKMCEAAQRDRFKSECQNLDHISVLLDLERRSHDMLERLLTEEIFKLKTECASLRENVFTVSEELRKNQIIILDLQYKNMELSRVSHFSRNILYNPYCLIS